MNSEFVNKSVGQLLLERPGRSRVFEQFRIDYCCGGKALFRDACAHAGVSPHTVAEALFESDRDGRAAAGRDWSVAPLRELIEHILDAHHAFLRRELPRLCGLGAKVAGAHARRFPWVTECQRVLADLRAELESHMMKEEHVLFPMIRQLEAAEVAPRFHCGALQNPITVMEHEHDLAGNALARLRELSAGFAPPDDACNTLRAWLDGLRELESDLREHIHEENNILFPRAQTLERQRVNA